MCRAGGREGLELKTADLEDGWLLYQIETYLKQDL